MNAKQKHQEMERKNGVTAVSFDPTTNVRENDVLPSPMGGRPKGQTTDFPENVNGKKEDVLISRLNVTEDLTVSYWIEKMSSHPPVPYISIDRKVGRYPDGRPRWIHVRVYDENSLEDLKTGLDKMLEMAMLPTRYLHMKVNTDDFLRLQEDGTMEEVHKYVSQIP